MNVFELASLVIESLEAENVDYMVVGALSTSVFGVPRSTKDVDIVISVESHAPLGRLEQLLKGVVVFDRQISFETITSSLRHTLTSVSRPPIIVELFELGNDPYVQTRFSRRRQSYSGQIKRKVWLPTPEDVIVQKLRWARNKDLDDARDVLAVQGSARLDMAYVPPQMECPI